MKLGTVLKQLRERIGLSQGHAAEAACINQSYLSQIENGTKSPSLDTLYRLAEVYETHESLILLKTIDEDELKLSGKYDCIIREMKKILR